MQTRVALLIETSGEYGRKVLSGIKHLSRLKGPWSFYLVPSGHEQRLPDIQLWQATGIIARVESLSVAKAIAKSGLPTIGLDLNDEVLRTLRRSTWVSEMHPDPVDITRLGFEHLSERGFRHVAFIGFSDLDFSNQRQQAFVRHATSAGLKCPVFAFRTKARANRYGYVEAKLARWLKEQPRPLGLMCCNDDCAREVLDTALVAGINVPDDIAVVGVDNDDILCDLCNPPLSSVIPDAFKTGYLAAELLNRVMSGQKVQEQSIAVAPVGVQTRQSTDVVAVSDHRISSAVRFIRENANKNICVKDVLQAVPMSRTILDASFKKLFRCTPHDHILRVRVELVKTLLRTTDLSLAAIADRTGFEHVEYMSVVFKRAMGFPPGHYRSQRIKSESRNELAI